MDNLSQAALIGIVAGVLGWAISVSLGMLSALRISPAIFKHNSSWFHVFFGISVAYVVGIVIANMSQIIVIILQAI